MKITTLDQVRNFLNDINAINCGGCGIAAYAMYLWLEKNNLAADYTVCFLYSYIDTDYHTNSAYLESNIGYPTSANHVVLFNTVTGEYIDAEETWTDETWSSSYWGGTNKILKVHKSKIHDFLIKSLMVDDRPVHELYNTSGIWNPAFNRNREITKINKTLGIDLNHVKYVDKLPTFW